MRAEAFVLGDSISELSSALDQAGKAELVAAPTAWAHAKKYWQGRDLQSGCVLVKSRISRHSSVFSPSDASGLSDTFGVTCSTAGGEATGQRLLPSSGRDTRTVTRAPSSAPRDPAQYLPNVVTKKLQAGITGQLADHRSVSILFLVQQVGAQLVHESPAGPAASFIADIGAWAVTDRNCAKADKSELATINSLKRLQSLLGAVIDVVEVTWGGSTRQVRRPRPPLAWSLGGGD